MNLITTAYSEKNDIRRAELREALTRNIYSKLFDKIIVAAEGQPAYLPLHKSLVVYPINARPTYQTLFSLAVPGVTVVANSDIFFDDSLKAVQHADLTNKLLCISRREVNKFGKKGALHNPYRSQDVWVFDAPLKAFNASFPLGVLGCDQRLAHEAQAAGLVVTNPCLTIHAWHLHFSGIRHYSKHRLPGKYARLAPCAL